MKNIKKNISILLLLSYLLLFIGNTRVYADTVIIPDGFTVVDQYNSGTYINETINQLLDSGVKNIFIKDGIYNLNGMININKSDVVLKGEDKNNTKLIQTTDSDSIGVIGVNNVTVSDLTIDNSTNGRASFSEGASSNVTLKNTIVYGQDANYFTVYFAGKNYPDGISNDPVQGLENDDMDTNNSMIDNTIYSKFDGDGVSFSVQKNGLVQNNTITGTRIAFYMCKDSKVINNTIKNSTSNGIAISVPSINNIISGNIIDSSKASGIKVSAELEYPVAQSYYGKNITITSNTVKNSHYMGIEVSKLSGSNISNNSVQTTDNIGIYLLLSDTLTVNQNNISDSGYSIVDGNVWGWNENLNSGIFIDYKVQNSIIDSNTLTNINVCMFGIREQKGNLNEQNSITNNKIWGNFTYPLSLADADKDIVGNDVKDTIPVNNGSSADVQIKGTVAPMITISVSTNSIDFGSVNSLETDYNQNMTVTVQSSNNYTLSVVAIDDFKGTDPANIISIDHLKVKVEGDVLSKDMSTTPVVLAENEPSTGSKSYDVNFKLAMDWKAKPDSYTTKVTFMAKQN
jgi:hypothetical protein